jgi:hypothetical protein
MSSDAKKALAAAQAYTDENAIPGGVTTGMLNTAITNEANARQGQVNQLNEQIQETNQSVNTLGQNLSDLNNNVLKIAEDLQTNDKATFGDPAVPDDKGLMGRVKALEDNGGGNVPAIPDGNIVVGSGTGIKDSGKKLSDIGSMQGIPGTYTLADIIPYASVQAWIEGNLTERVFDGDVRLEWQGDTPIDENLNFNNITFTNASDYGLYIYSYTNTWANNVTFSNVRGGAVTVEQGTISGNISVYDCFSFRVVSAFTVLGSGECRISGTSFYVQPNGVFNAPNANIYVRQAANVMLEALSNIAALSIEVDGQVRIEEGAGFGITDISGVGNISDNRVSLGRPLDTFARRENVDAELVVVNSSLANLGGQLTDQNITLTALNNDVRRQTEGNSISVAITAFVNAPRVSSPHSAITVQMTMNNLWGTGGMTVLWSIAGPSRPVAQADVDFIEWTYQMALLFQSQWLDVYALQLADVGDDEINDYIAEVSQTLENALAQHVIANTFLQNALSNGETITGADINEIWGTAPGNTSPMSTPVMWQTAALSNALRKLNEDYSEFGLIQRVEMLENYEYSRTVDSGGAGITCVDSDGNPLQTFGISGGFSYLIKEWDSEFYIVYINGGSFGGGNGGPPPFLWTLPNEFYMVLNDVNGMEALVELLQNSQNGESLGLNPGALLLLDYNSTLGDSARSLSMDVKLVRGQWIDGEFCECLRFTLNGQPRNRPVDTDNGISVSGRFDGMYFVRKPI